MASVKEIRLANLLSLIAKEDSLAAFARKTGTEPIYLRQIKDQVKDSKTGRPRQMGDVIAARIEKALGMEAGDMDRPLVSVDVTDGADVLEAHATVGWPVGSKQQLMADWEALPEGWRFYLCKKASKLREWSDQMPSFIKETLKPIKDDSEYHAWEARLEASLAEKEQREVNPTRAEFRRNEARRGEQ